MVQQVILVVDDRPLPAHEQHGFAVRQQAHFIRRQQVAGDLLLAGAVAAAAAPAAAVAGCVHGLLANQFGDVLVRALLVASEIEKLVAQADQRFPAVLV